MELIAAAVAFYAIVLPVFLVLEMGGNHLAGPDAHGRGSRRRLARIPAPAAANDAFERIAA